VNLPNPDHRPAGGGRAPAAPPKTRSIFTVSAAGERLGLPVACVNTIFRVSRITPIPLGPPEVVGLVNLRGKIVTAASLRRRLGHDASTSHEGAIAIGIEHRGESFALLVDEVGDVVTVDESARIPAPANLSAERLGLTAAVYRLDEAFISVFDMDAILDFNRPATARQ
jgi:purine-binding chemotaxis protein CheW